jgi:hypothetical protein
MRFVWAKCAFSVLLVLRLAVLLKDSWQTLVEHIHNARELLAELQKVGASDLRYTHILAVSVEKCERAVQEMQNHQQTPSTVQGINDIPEMNIEDPAPTYRSVEEQSVTQLDLSPLETYVPQELLYEWAFPGNYSETIFGLIQLLIAC